MTIARDKLAGKALLGFKAVDGKTVSSKVGSKQGAAKVGNKTSAAKVGTKR